MFCSNCGAELPDGTKFCTKCGSKLVKEESENLENGMFNMESDSNSSSSDLATNTATIDNTQQEHIEPTSNETNKEAQKQQTVKEKISNNETVKKGINIIMFYVAVLLKPIKSFKEKETEISKTKNAIIFTCISSIVYAIANIITTIFNTVIVKNLWSGETKWVWDNLKNINFFKLTFQSILIPLGAIALIALAYFAFAFIFKKKINYIKALSIVAVAIMPAILCKMILGPLVALMWSLGGSIISYLGMTYSIIVILFAINNEVEFENKDQLIYYNAMAVCSIVAVAVILFSTVLSPLNDLKDSINSSIDSISSLFD